MKKLIKRILKYLLGYRTYKSDVYSGRGYLQGIGFNLITEHIELRTLGIDIITSVSISTDSEWLRKLKIRWAEDDVQQKIEINRQRAL